MIECTNAANILASYNQELYVEQLKLFIILYKQIPRLKYAFGYISYIWNETPQNHYIYVLRILIR